MKRLLIFSVLSLCLVGCSVVPVQIEYVYIPVRCNLSAPVAPTYQNCTITDYTCVAQNVENLSLWATESNLTLQECLHVKK